ncbi:WXG100 family type VII secretion target [Streptomyces sp. NPDC058700]|uniref:WXG100 family type VII secretion target n=1 Tax=Streptomyces sp. NPDC058700 TaxID=3346607 RepID=UPI003646D2D9
MGLAEGGGGGGGTNFRSMTHQQMLDWLDEAETYPVRNAADRLKAAAVELERIAAQLKNRTGRVDWKGEAEKAFTEWAESVVSSTRSLGKYSTDAATWMDNASQAIASAKSAIPRYTSHEAAKASLEAAQKYRNDPDSATIARDAQKSLTASEDLKAIEAKEKANQQAAAAEMEKLSSSYQWSSLNMKNLEPPTFPPPPGDFVPADSGHRTEGAYTNGNPSSQGERYSANTEASTGTHTTRPQPDTRITPDVPDTTTTPPTGDRTGPTHVVKPEARPDVPVDLGIDSVDTLPPTTTGPTTQTPGGPPPVTKPDGATPPFVTTGMPPLQGKGGPGGLGRTAPVTGGTGNARGPITGGARGLAGGPGPLGGTREGVSGGRAVPSTMGRPGTGIPRSTVIGTETGGRNGTAMGRGPMGGGMGGAMGGGMGAGQTGVSGGRRLAGETGGVVGSRAQRPGTGGAVGGGARPFTPGGSGLVRGGSTQAGGEREEQSGKRPDYLVEDEETWQQGNRRPAPPVID